MTERLTVCARIPNNEATWITRLLVALREGGAFATGLFEPLCTKITRLPLGIPNPNSPPLSGILCLETMSRQVTLQSRLIAGGIRDSGHTNVRLRGRGRSECLNPLGAVYGIDPLPRSPPGACTPGCLHIISRLRLVWSYRECEGDSGDGGALDRVPPRGLWLQGATQPKKLASPSGAPRLRAISGKGKEEQQT
jgi:hypothetical protein